MLDKQTLVRKTRLDWVDAGKGISILLVVVYHATGWMTSAGLGSESLNQLNGALVNLRMPVFFLLAGLFASKWVYGSWASLLRNKVALFGWVYLLWSFLALPTKWLAMAVLTEKVEESFFIRQAFVLLMIPLRASGAIWFIWALLCFFVLAKLTRDFPHWLQLIVAGVAALAARSMPSELTDTVVEATGLGYRGALLFYFFFLSGMLFRPAIQTVVEKLTPLLAICILIGWSSAWIGLNALGLLRVGIVSFLVACTAVAASIALAFLLQGLRPLRWVGANTLPIYLAHAPMLILVVASLRFVPLEGDLERAIVTLLVSAVAVGMTLVLYRFRNSGLRFLYQPPPGVQDWVAKRAGERSEAPGNGGPITTNS